MSKIKVAVIGCGSISKHRHIPEYASNSNVELVAFVDPFWRERSTMRSCMAAKLIAVILKC